MLWYVQRWRGVVVEAVGGGDVRAVGGGVCKGGGGGEGEVCGWWRCMEWGEGGGWRVEFGGVRLVVGGW